VSPKWPAAVALVAFAAGCGSVGGGGSTKTIARTGAVGRALTGPGGLSVQLVRYLPRVAPKKDVTRMATPADGTRFVAFQVRMCVKTSGLPILSDSNFTVPLAGGGRAVLKFPQTVFADDLNLLGEPGCERGYIVFQVPRPRRASLLHFALDVQRSNAEGFTDSTKIRFEWSLPR
jgi:hypothetical protein